MADARRADPQINLGLTGHNGQRAGGGVQPGPADAGKAALEFRIGERLARLQRVLRRLVDAQPGALPAVLPDVVRALAEPAQ